VLVFATFLIASHHQNVDLRINVISMIIAYGLGYVLISWLGGLGAGLAVLSAITIFMMQQLMFIFRHMFRIDFWQLTYRLILSAVMMGAVTWLLRQMHVLIAIACGALVYFGLLNLLRVFTLKDIRYLVRLKK